MKRMFLCGAMMLGLAGIVGAQSVPLSVSFPDHELVQIDPGYQTTTPVAVVPDQTAAVEYSQDGFVYGVDLETDTLLRVDPTTGTVQPVGPLGIDLAGPVDLDEDDQGQLWMLPCNSGELYRIDTNTGAATLDCQTPTFELCGLATFGGSRWTTTLLQNPPADPGCGFEILQSNTISTSSYLDSGRDRLIYAIHYSTAVGFLISAVSRIDPATGVEEPLGLFSYQGIGPGLILSGVTLNPNDQPEPGVPEMGWPGIAAMTFLLLAAGCWLFLRRS